MTKDRPAQQVAEIGYVIGDVEGKTAVIVDDIIDSAGTLYAAAQTVLDEGAARSMPRRRTGSSRGTPTRSSRACPFEQIVVTDTIPLRPGAPDNVVVLSVAGLLADTITQIFTDGSVSACSAARTSCSRRAGAAARQLRGEPRLAMMTRSRRTGGNEGGLMERPFGIDAGVEGVARSARALRRRRSSAVGSPGSRSRCSSSATARDSRAGTDKRTEPAPEAAFKVGESSVEVGAHYYREVIGMRDHLEQYAAPQARPALPAARRRQQRHHASASSSARPRISRPSPTRSTAGASRTSSSDAA